MEKRPKRSNRITGFVPDGVPGGRRGLIMADRMRFLTYILAGLRHRPGRNLATFFCFAFIAVNIFTGQFLIAGAAGGVDRGVTRMGADQMIVPSSYMAYLQGAGPNN